LPEKIAVPVTAKAFAPIVAPPTASVVAVATPSAGVTNAGEVVRLIAPEPLAVNPRAVRTPVPVVVVAGATPAPPPTTKAFAASAADEAHVEAELKYGTPPDVPATVNAGVVVGVATETKPPVQPTDVTVPEPPPPLPVVSSLPFTSQRNELRWPFASVGSDE
jgi:hypothetical protein